VIRLAVRCRADSADRVLAELLELVPGGVEEERGPEWAEFAIYGAPGELPALPALEAAAADGLIEVSSTEVPDDWADRWRDFHEPVWVDDGRLVVRPSWHHAHPASDPAAPGRRSTSETPEAKAEGKVSWAGAEEAAGSCSEQPAGIDVVIDPGQAFGTGAHATTRMCLELMLALADAGEASGSLVDLGTGSGVLAIAAAKLGWAPVVAVDHERAALEAAASNAQTNGVELKTRRLNLREQPPPAAETMVANLTAPLLSVVAPRIGAATERVVCSGLLASEVEEVVRAFESAGLVEARRRASGEWVALGFARS
jgi:ribosomal protein L11 methyltransferase